MATIDDILGSPQFLKQLIGEEEFSRTRDQALNQGILQASLAALGGRGNASQVISQAGTAGLQGYQGAFDRTLSDMAKSMQIQELQRKQQIQKSQRQALQAATTGVQPAVIPEGQTLRDDQGELTMGSEVAKAVPSAFNADIYKTYALRLGVDPKDIGSTLESMQGKTMTVKPGEVVLGADMKPIYTAPAESKGQIVDTAQGMMIYDPVARTMVPALDAKGNQIMGDKGKAPQKFTDSVVNIKNMRTAITDYITDLQGTDARFVFPGSTKGAELGTKFTNLQMQLKNLYELGAITGPDLQLLNNAVTDPTSMLGRYKGKESLGKQVEVISGILTKNEKNLYETYKQPIPANLEKVADVRSPQERLGIKSIPKGVVINGVTY